MGRMKRYRQRVRSQAASVEAKGLLEYLTSEIRRRREMPTEEAKLVAREALAYLERHHLTRGCGVLELPLIEGRSNLVRAGRKDQPEKLVPLTLLADEDAELLAEAGNVSMLTHRMARVIEEAYEADAAVDAQRLCLLFPLTFRALRHRLKRLWSQGALLPVAGAARRFRDEWRAHRGVLAVERYVMGESLTAIRKELMIPLSVWQRWWSSARRVIPDAGSDPEAIAEREGAPITLVKGWQALASRLPDTAEVRRRLEESVANAPEQKEAVSSTAAFCRLLVRRFGYSPAAADLFETELYDLSRVLESKQRSGGQILYFGVASDEPPGRALSEANLVPAVLDYVTTDDWQQVDVDTPQALKWPRIERLATQSYAQGMALSLPDLAFLVGLSTDAVANVIGEHPNVLLPTRGRVADMGTTTSHTAQIIELYMHGYTETEVKRRTGHSYDSIERYLIDFARVSYLAEKGMPAPAIRTMTGLSRRVVEKHLELYTQFSTPEFAFRMGRIRRIAEAHPPKKTHESRKGGDIIMAKGPSRSRFASFVSRELETVQLEHLRRSFELAPDSALGRAVAERVNTFLAEQESESEERRVPPGELVIETDGGKATLPLITPEWGRRLADGTSPQAVRRQLEHEQLRRLEGADGSLPVLDVWRWVNQTELARKRGSKDEAFVPETPLDTAGLELPRRAQDQAPLPANQVEKLVSYFEREYGVRPSLARSMIEKAAAVRCWCCPRLGELQPGQLVWMAHHTEHSRGRSRHWVPVRLTLLTPEEATSAPETRSQLRRLKMAQIERLTAEAWRQDAVLTMLDLEWLLQVPQTFIRNLLDAYHEEHGVLLPTAGTILDMGRTMTHKAIVIEMALDGLTTQEIGRRIFHTPEAVDNYLKAFDRVLLAKHYGLPDEAIGRITGHSPSLVAEHLRLVEKHFENEEAIAEYLGQRGISLENVASGA